jgi:succinate dehydrogenase / fumarate reductase flavoprotein subunit
LRGDKKSMNKTGVLVIGSGGAGLTSALSAKKNGLDVLVRSESYPTRSQSSMAQGGINAVLTTDNGDSIEQHIEDTIKASGGLADEKMVRLMCETAPKVIEWLDSLGVPFSSTKD